MLKHDQFLDEFERVYTKNVVAKTVRIETRTDDQRVYYQCDYTWEAISANYLFVSCMVRYAKALSNSAVVWFLGSDPYPGSKPFKIVWIGIDGTGAITLVLNGQNSKRIVGKWSTRMQQFFKRKVNLTWEVK